MIDKDPFGYPLVTYMWVIGLAAFASVIRHLNNVNSFIWGRVLVEAMSGGFTGLLTFWLCEWANIGGPLSAFMIGVSGLFGARIWQEFLYVFRMRLGIPVEMPIDETQPEPPLNPVDYSRDSANPE